MTIKNNGKTTFGSILIGILTFGFFGFSIYNALMRLDIIMPSNLYMYGLLGIGAIIGIIFGLLLPLFTEVFSFAIMSLIVVQGVWDITYDIQQAFGDGRVKAAGLALVIIIINRTEK